MDHISRYSNWTARLVAVDTCTPFNPGTWVNRFSLAMVLHRDLQTSVAAYGVYEVFCFFDDSKRTTSSTSAGVQVTSPSSSLT